MATAWPEVNVPATSATADMLEAWLFAAGALSVTYRDERDGVAGSQPVLEPAPGEVRLWQHITLVGLFAQEHDSHALHGMLQQAAVEQALDLPAYQMQQLPDTVWERSWMSDFAPMQFGPKLWICPSHCKPQDASAVNIKLDPGLAFGTGTHATTAECLNWLGRRTGATTLPFSGQQVIDYGCGSGVLAIAAACLGAQTVWAVDIDPQALIATRSNACENGVEERIVVGEPALVNKLQADVVLANILYQPLMTLAEAFAACVRPGGQLVMSGVLDEQAASLCLRYNSAFDFAPTVSRDGWALLMATRRPV